MTIDYIPNINNYGDNIVRLYDFDKHEAQKFSSIIEQLIKDKQTVELSSLDFITVRNCHLSLRIADEDLGISSEIMPLFVCDLSLKGYEDMLNRLAPLCKKNIKGFKWLYELDNPTDFLASPAGTW
jgi:hypothetical protein